MDKQMVIAFLLLVALIFSFVGLTTRIVERIDNEGGLKSLTERAWNGKPEEK